MMGTDALDLSGLEQEQEKERCQHGIGGSSSVKCEKFIN
jgi:hypothetical protein